MNHFGLFLTKGAFGVVYLAKWRNADAVVKQMIGDSSNVNERNKFLREGLLMRYVPSY